MILRKPYALLIKYFKTIHIVMFVLFTYLVFSLRKIYVFFAEYIKNSNFTYVEGMASKYVPWILFLIVIVLLALAIGILLLMRKKEKPVLFYRIMIIYTIVLLGIFIYFSVFFKSLDNTLYEPLKIVVNRDISLFVYIFNFFFVVFSFIRGFGFDIKKFSFDKDKKELNLEESDSEEYELNVNIEKADVKSFLNKQKREFSYYFKENKKFFIIVSIIIVLSLGLYFYYDIFVINKVYKEGDNISVGALKYRVNNSIISDIDKYGQVIQSDNDYLIISINIGLERAQAMLNEQGLRVHIDDDYYYPISSSCDLFNDVGSCYNSQIINGGTYNDYIFVYKIKKQHEKIYLEILKSIGDEYQYSKVELSYTTINMEDVEYHMNDSINIGDKTIAIKNYKFYDKTSFEYEECNEDKCNKYTKKVTPYLGEAIMSIEVEGIENIKEDFMKSAFGIKDNDKIYNGKDIKFVAKNDNILYYSVPKHLTSTENLKLLITTRKVRNNILLEEVVNE
jgi:hypothetical protein